MPGIIPVSPKQAFATASGGPLANGTLTVYLAGTTTLTPTWQDVAQTTLNTNPIVLDARGECSIWLNPLLTYKFLLKDSGGATIYTVDNIYGASSNASGITYLLTATGAVTTTVQAKLNEFVSVLDFGADPTGVSDSTTAIQNAINYALTTGLSFSGAVGMGSRKKLWFPAGVYKVISSLTGGSYLDWFGERAIITATTDTFPIVSAVQYMTNFEGIQFEGGTVAIAIATGNVDSVVINIKNCEFQQQTTACITMDNNSPSTITNIDKCKFYNTNTGAKILSILSADVCNFTDCWVSASCYTGFQIGDATYSAVLNVRGMCGVPLSGPALQTWFLNYGKLRVTHSRLGGEFGGAVTVRNYAGISAVGDPTALILTQNEIFCANPNSPVIFFRLPNIFIFEDNNGLADTKGFRFDAGAQTDSYVYSPSSTVFSYKNNSFDTLMFKGDMFAGMRALLRAEQSRSYTDTVMTTAEVVLQIPANSGGFGVAISSSGVTTAGSTNLFGSPTNSISANGTAGDSNFWTQSFTTALAGFTSDSPYTMEVPVEVTGIKPFTILMTACNQQFRFNVAPGKHVLSFPFIYHVAAPSANIAKVEIYEIWTSAANVIVGGYRFLANTKKSTTVNVVVHGTAAPVAGTWQRGDRVIQSTPTVGQPKAWVCTVAGAPGTWVSEGNL